MVGLRSPTKDSRDLDPPYLRDSGWQDWSKKKDERAATMAEDYYSVLGVPKNATQADIQKAYR